jgi:hypothetical protein
VIMAESVFGVEDEVGDDTHANFGSLKRNKQRWEWWARHVDTGSDLSQLLTHVRILYHV